jgi:FixJ family two-component response regulator
VDADGIADCEAILDSFANLVPSLICICDSKNLPACVKAFSGTGHEILPKPFSSEALLEASEKTLRRSEQSLQMAAKYRKMRQLVRRVVRERRDINRRLELVCRDLVEAHRRLTYRFVQMQQRDCST